MEIQYNELAEKSVLLSCFLSSDALYKALDLLEPNDFYNNSHKMIFSAMEDLQSCGIGIDRTTVLSELNHNTAVEAFEELFNHSDVDPENIEHYCNLIEQKAKLRFVLDATYSIQNMVNAGDMDADSIISVTQDSLFQASKRKDQKNLKLIGTFMDEFADNIASRIGKDQSELLGLKSGIEAFDKIWLGAEPDQLIILAGRPSMGKTQLSVQIAINALLEGKRVAFFSLEMSKSQLMERVISHVSEIFLSKIKAGKLSPKDVNNLKDVYATIKNFNLILDDTPYQTAQTIESKTRRIAQEFGEVDLVVVDYMQLMAGSNKKAQTRNEEVTDISRRMKLLAKSLGIPVIVLSQLSRTCESRPDRRPILSDLRESGAIEQDADKVIFMYSDFPYTRKPEHNEKAEVILAKHRNGPTGVVHIRNLKNIQKMTDVDGTENDNLLPNTDDVPF